MQAMADSKPSTTLTSVPSTPIQRKRKPLHFRDVAPYVFISPFFVLFFVFGLFPLLFSMYLSFHRWDPAAGLAAMNWVGLENYIFVITNDDWFHSSLYNTVWLALVSGLPQHLVALPLAFFLHTAFGRWRNAVVGAYFLPFITSTVAISLVFSSLFSRDFGVVNATLTALHDVPGLSWFFPAEKIDWGQPQYTKWMISFVVWWRYVGWNAVLYLSAMQTIPKDLFEAATMDGAKPWQQFRHVCLPLLRPMIFFAVTLSIIGNLQLFEEPFILTGGTGGIDQAGKTAAMHMYATAFVDGDFGTASAIAWLLFMLIAGVTWANNRFLGQRDTKG
ncbi:cytochrome C biogenesis protein [Rhizobacter sp. Root1221]|nr:cytochrome C biogenesis protein [Rhizobacter sp. Root1221]